MPTYSSPFARVRAGNKRVDTSVASNRVNSSALSSATGKTRAERKKPEWDADISDLDRYKLSQEEMLRKRSLFVSKHNIFSSPSVSKVSAKKAMRKKRDSTAKREAGTMKDPLLELTSLDYLREESNDDGDASSSSAGDAPDASSDKEGRAVAPRSKRSIERSPATVRPYPNKNEDVDITVDLCRPANHAARSNSVAGKKTLDGVDSSARSRRSISPRLRLGFASLSPKTAGAKQISSSNVHRDTISTSALKTAVPKDVLEMLVGLQHELRSYEQISGKRSVFDESELDDLLATYTADGEDREGVSLEGVIRYLLQLVCQSMTYLLESEIKINQQKTDYDTLSKRVDILTTLIASGGASIAPSSNSNKAVSPSIDDDRIQAKSVGKPDLESLLSRYDVPSVDGIFSRASVPSGDATSKLFSTPAASPMNTTTLPKYDGDISSVPRKMGTSTSDWLFASPIANVASPATPVATNSIYTTRTTVSPSAAAMQTTDVQSVSKRGVDEAFHSQRAKQAARVSGRLVSDVLVHSLGETSMCYSMTNDVSGCNEDESDKKYHENLNSVARRLHMAEGGTLDDSTQYDLTTLSAALELPPPPPPMMMLSTPDSYSADRPQFEYHNTPPLPSSRVEKLQRALKTNTRPPAASPFNSTEHAVLFDSRDNTLNSTPATGAPFRPSGEQMSVGGPIAHAPMPLAAPQHPFKQQRGEGEGVSASAYSPSKTSRAATPSVNLLDSFKGRLTFDATRGSY